MSLDRAKSREAQAKKHKAVRMRGGFVRGTCNKKDFAVRSNRLKVECPECRAEMNVTEKAAPKPEGKTRAKAKAKAKGTSKPDPKTEPETPVVE